MSDLQAWVGRPVGEPVTAEVPVNEAMIVHWCRAIGDTNPTYPAVAPPAMLDVWTMHRLDHSWLTGSVAPVIEGRHVMRDLDEMGYTSVVATNVEQEYVRYLEPGDLVSTSRVVESVSDLKRTALGEGYFVTWRNTFTVGDEVVGTQLFRVFKFKPLPRRPARPAPVVVPENEFFWEGVKVGELRMQRCTSCGTLRHPPRPACPSCTSLEADHLVSSGRGTVVSWIKPRHPKLPAFGDDYTVVLVQLEEGTRIVSNLVDGEPSMGQRVEVVFRDGLPLFSPLGDA